MHMYICIYPRIVYVYLQLTVGFGPKTHQQEAFPSTQPMFTQAKLYSTSPPGL